MPTDTPPPARTGAVPYIASWSEEYIPVGDKVIARQGGVGICYRDETPADRGILGVLLKRGHNTPGRGKPEFGLMHGARQRHAMLHLLCQICAQPADRTEQGVLWLLPDDRDDWPNWPESTGETTPPTCLPCADTSRRQCPRLRRGYAAVRVKAPVLAGVYGVVHLPLPSGLGRGDIGGRTVRFTDPFLPWTLAYHLVLRLLGCTLIDLDHELTTRSSNNGDGPTPASTDPAHTPGNNP